MAFRHEQVAIAGMRIDRFGFDRDVAEPDDAAQALEITR
jgi:hypothetical protein